ncbi:glycoside hydrolase superfamily [Flagelloscypha sp. PMI_526]|nr:glycoside hydrolase superfamily [Flagelloscypha sp. PMI_526]
MSSETEPLLPPSSKGHIRRKSFVPGRRCRDATLVVLLILFPVVLLFSAWIAIEPTTFFFGRKLLDENPYSIPGGPLLPPKVGKLPFLGYNTWNAYHCDINETVILETAELMVSMGFKDLGYEYLNIDDCYSEKKRNDAGEIVENKERFPSGMRSLTDKIHGLGLKAGIYSDSGWYTCQMYPGSYLHEEQDVKTFQGDWGFDLLKFDNCAVPFDSVIKQGMVQKFNRMATAVVKVANDLQREPMLFSLCQWGRETPWLWARHYGQTWRTTDDIGPHWNAISSIINQATRYSWASDFFGHNDLDILEIGNYDNDFTFDEAKTHFTFWALYKSPLLIGADLAKLKKEDIEIYSNKELININQDPVFGKSITPFRWGKNWDYTNDYTYPAQFWSMQSQNGTVVLIINVEETPKDLSFTFVESPWLRAGALYSIRDLWSHTDNGTFYRNFTAKAVPAHGSVALLLKDVGDEPPNVWPPCANPEWCTDQNGTIIYTFNQHKAVWADSQFDMESYLVDDTKVDVKALQQAKFGKTVPLRKNQKWSTRKEERRLALQNGDVQGRPRVEDRLNV